MFKLLWTLAQSRIQFTGVWPKTETLWIVRLRMEELKLNGKTNIKVFMIIPGLCKDHLEQNKGTSSQSLLIQVCILVWRLWEELSSKWIQLYMTDDQRCLVGWMILDRHGFVLLQMYPSRRVLYTTQARSGFSCRPIMDKIML